MLEAVEQQGESHTMTLSFRSLTSPPSSSFGGGNEGIPVYREKLSAPAYVSTFKGKDKGKDWTVKDRIGMPPVRLGANRERTVSYSFKQAFPVPPEVRGRVQGPTQGKLCCRVPPLW